MVVVQEPVSVVTMNFPYGCNVVNIPRTSEFLCKDLLPLPGQTITEIAVPFRGRNLYLVGDREFETWETTFLNDTNFDIRNAMERWMNGMNELVRTWSYQC